MPSTMLFIGLCIFFTDSDFKSILNLPVTFAPDESEERVTIQTSADSVLEGTEQFSAVLSSPPDRVAITQNTADISIRETRDGVCVYVFVNAHVCVFVLVFLFLRRCVCVCVYLYVCVYLCVYVGICPYLSFVPPLQSSLSSSPAPTQSMRMRGW